MKKDYVWRQILIGFPIIAILAFLIFSTVPSFVDGTVKFFSRPVRDFLGTVNSVFPFSVMEILIAVAVILIIIFIVRTFTNKPDEFRKKHYFRRFCILLLVAAYILTGYLWLWGIDYRAASFSDESGISDDAVGIEELYYVTAQFVFKACALADNVPRDENGHFSAEPDDYLPNAVRIYDALQEQYPTLAGECRVPKKMIASELMSITGFTGIFFPFTGESNLNVNSTQIFIPSTAAHELAHQLGVTSELECNFLSVASCITSGDDIYEYSGYLAGATYLMNALYSVSPDLWSYLRQYITGSMEVDWLDNVEYWEKYETPVIDFSFSIYDKYLKINGDPSGIRSYGACVNMLVNYYLYNPVFDFGSVGSSTENA